MYYPNFLSLHARIMKVMSILHSNKMSTSNDKTGCIRAYHLMCLDPPIQSLSKAGFEEDDDWFCWRCEVLDYVLDSINSVLDTDYDEYNLFPELGGGLAVISDIEDEMEDEEDESYNPEEASDGEHESGVDKDEGDSDTDSDSDTSMISSDELGNLVAEGGADVYLGDGSDGSGYYTRNQSLNSGIDVRSKILTIEDFDEANVLPDGARRKRNKVDYVKLSQEMFGDAEDSDAEQDHRRNIRKNCHSQGSAGHINDEGNVLENGHEVVVKRKRGRPRSIDTGRKVLENSHQIIVKRKRGRPRKSDSLLHLGSSPNASSHMCGDRNEFKHRLLSQFPIPSSEPMSSPECVVQTVKIFMESMGVMNIHDYCNSEGIEYKQFMTYIAGISLGYYDQYMSKEQITFFRDIASSNMRRFDQLLENSSS